MFFPKLLMPVLTGFTTTNRYTSAVGLTTPDNTPLLNAHTIRFNGSNGSGTDSGRTTLSPSVATDFAAGSLETDADCAAQCATRQHVSATIMAKRFTFSQPPEFGYDWQLPTFPSSSILAKKVVPGALEDIS